VIAYDTAGNESDPSQTVWINILQDTTVTPEPAAPDTVAPESPEMNEPAMQPIVVCDYESKFILTDGKTERDFVYHTGGGVLLIPASGHWQVDMFLGAIKGSPVITFNDSTKTHEIFITDRGYLYQKDVDYRSGEEFALTVSGGDVWIKKIELIWVGR